MFEREACNNVVFTKLWIRYADACGFVMGVLIIETRLIICVNCTWVILASWAAFRRPGFTTRILLGAVQFSSLHKLNQVSCQTLCRPRESRDVSLGCICFKIAPRRESKTFSTPFVGKKSTPSHVGFYWRWLLARVHRQLGFNIFSTRFSERKLLWNKLDKGFDLMAVNKDKDTDTESKMLRGECTHRAEV